MRFDESAPGSAHWVGFRCGSHGSQLAQAIGTAESVSFDACAARFQRVPSLGSQCQVVTQRQLDLLQRRLAGAGQLGKGAPQVVWRQVPTECLAGSPVRELRKSWF
jgi:hypothetical protein